MEQNNNDDHGTIDESSLIPMCVLGQGSYGSITLMRDSHNRCYAKKTCLMNLQSNLQKELDIMLRFHDHPRIVQAKNPFLHFENNKEGQRVCYIYMEYAKEHSLQKLISDARAKSSLPLPDYTVQRAARMILQGLEALHSKGYVHRDLKPSNVLLFSPTTWEDPWDLKLADFGLSKEPNTTESSSSRVLLGTHLYMPPESFEPEAVEIDGALDIWSLGCIVYEMFGGKPRQEIREDYYDWILSHKISPVAKNFLDRCHAPYSRRPTAVELLNHPFITQNLTMSLPTSRLELDSNWLPRLPGSIW